MNACMQPQETSTSVRRLVWWPDRALTGLAARIDVAWQAWCGDWGLGAGLVVARNAFEAGAQRPRAWHALDGVRSGAAWLGFMSDVPLDAVERWLFGEPARCRHGESLASQAAAKALRGLGDALVRCLALGPAASPGSSDAAVEPSPAPNACRAWSGAVRVTLDSARSRDEALALHLSPEAAAAVLGAPKSTSDWPNARPLVSVEQAAASLPVRLRVEIAGVDLDVGTLATLRPGDVVAVSHALCDPVHVEPLLPASGAPCQAASPWRMAALGARRGRRAVQLVR